MKTSIFQNSNEKTVRISALKLGASKLPESHKEAIKTFRAEILTIFLLLFWKIDVVHSFI
jgi:hypothetical protein